MTTEAEAGTGFVNVAFSTSTVASSKEAYSVTVSLPVAGSASVEAWSDVGYEALHLAQQIRELARITVEGHAAEAEEGSK